MYISFTSICVHFYMRFYYYMRIFLLQYASVCVYMRLYALYASFHPTHKMGDMANKFFPCVIQSSAVYNVIIFLCCHKSDIYMFVIVLTFRSSKNCASGNFVTCLSNFLKKKNNNRQSAAKLLVLWDQS